VGDEGHLGPQWAQVRPCRGVGPDPWRVLAEETSNGEAVVQAGQVEGDDEGVVEARRGRGGLLRPPVWRRPYLLEVQVSAGARRGLGPPGPPHGVVPSQALDAPHYDEEGVPPVVVDHQPCGPRRPLPLPTPP